MSEPELRAVVASCPDATRRHDIGGALQHLSDDFGLQSVGGPSIGQDGLESALAWDRGVGGVPPPAPSPKGARMPIHLDDDRRAELVESLQGFWLTEFDEELSAFRADQVLRFVLERVGSRMYNQGVQDARAWVLTKLDDLDGEVHEPEIAPG